MSRAERTEQQARAYLGKLIAFALGLAALVLAITLTLDPYGVSPVAVEVPGLNQNRYMRHQVDRLVKPLDVLAQQPRTIVMGTSRVNQGFEPADFKETGLAPVYNLGIDFANPTDSLALLEALLPFAPSIEVAIIEINFHHFFNLRDVSVPESGSDLLFNIMQAQFSWSALRATLVSTFKNRSFPESAYWLTEGGRMLLPGRTSFMEDVGNFLNRLDRTYAGGFRLELDAQDVVFDRIGQVCDTHDVRCLYVILPYQPVDLVHHVVSDRWRDLVRAKAYFLDRGGVYDFTRFNRFTNETPSDNMKYWQDINHFTPTVGRYIGHVLAGSPLPDTPENFGVRLTSENFDSEMQAWAQERDLWLSQNAAVQEQVRAAIFAEDKPGGQ